MLSVVCGTLKLLEFIPENIQCQMSVVGYVRGRYKMYVRHRASEDTLKLRVLFYSLSRRSPFTKYVNTI